MKDLFTTQGRAVAQDVNFIGRRFRQVDQQTALRRGEIRLFKTDPTLRSRDLWKEFKYDFKLFSLLFAKAWSDFGESTHDAWRLFRYQIDISTTASRLANRFLTGDKSLSEYQRQIEELEAKKYRPGDLKSRFDIFRRGRSATSWSKEISPDGETRTEVLLIRAPNPTSGWLRANDWVKNSLSGKKS